jgi:hypothetical protein
VSTFDDALAALAALCELEDLPAAGDWSVDRWEMSPEAVEKLVALYVSTLVPISAELGDELEEDGINLAALLLDEDAAADVITRSDMTELAAVAGAVKSMGLDMQLTVVPNVPKGSRSGSHPGIDVLGASISQGELGDPLDDDEWLLIGSVKHTIADGSDMRYKLDRSLGLTLPYVTSQVRVLHGRLRERGLLRDRIFNLLADFPNGPHIRAMGVACSNAPHCEVFLGGLGGFSGAPFDHGHIRCIVIDSILELHERVSI